MDGLTGSCPNCGSTDLKYADDDRDIGHCNACNEEWALPAALERYGIDPDGSGQIEDESES